MTTYLSPGALKIADHAKFLQLSHPSFHIVLGSGFKDSLLTGIPAAYTVRGELYFRDVPGLHASTAPGHTGKYVFVEHQVSKKVGLIQVGRLHGYEGLEPREVVLPIMYSRELGATHYFITNAAGGIDKGHQPGHVMMISDQINLTGKNPLFGMNPKKLNGEDWGPRFPDLTQVFDPAWIKTLTASFLAEGLTVHEGVYMGVLGPAFETPAEIRFFAKVGAQAVGMSTVWETMALKHSGATVCGISLISNVAAGLLLGPDGNFEQLDHFAILDACKSSSSSILKGILVSVEKVLLKS